MKRRDFVLNASVSAEKKRESEGEASRVTVQSHRRERLKNFYDKLFATMSVIKWLAEFWKGVGGCWEVMCVGDFES